MAPLNYEASRWLSPYVIPGLIREFTDEDVHTAIDHVCDHFSVSRESVFRRCRKQEIIRARFALIWVLRKKMKFKFQAIADMFNQDHTTAVHAVCKMEDYMDVYPEFTEELKLLIRTIPLTTGLRRSPLNLATGR